MKYKKLFFAISLFFLIPSIFSLVSVGLKPSIDFVGGSQLEIRINDENVNETEIFNTLSELYIIDNVKLADNNKYVISGENINNEIKQQAIVKLGNKYQEVAELKFETVGAILSKELLSKTLTALFLVAAIITIYVWKQFDELKYGVCAILAMFHDSIILLGTFSILGYFFGVQVDVLFVTALLTTLSFSVHDTIVVYDRIRELKRKRRAVDYTEIVNMAVTETLSRSINNSITIILMLFSLALLGGDSIRWFAVALLVGAVTGTYSSTFTAAPLLLLWDEIVIKRSKLKKKK
ncbi:protein translocase subunit SecF [Patescibacteria group bacterium]|nr:protein translocase subunit SecF [Patescibacteria group bacterium]